MAIQMRRGNAVDFDPSKMIPGEWAVSQDNEKLYMCFTAGRVIEIGTTTSIITYVKDAEAWALGTKDGTPVPDSDPTFHNNAKYYAETVAVLKVQDAEAWAVGERGGTPVPISDDTYHNNAEYYSQQSNSYAVEAALSEINAAASESNSEAWAIGERSGVPVPSGDVAYQNNSKYYAEQSGNYWNLVDDAVSFITPIVNINFITGELEITGTTLVFSINTTTGDLEWDVSHS